MNEITPEMEKVVRAAIKEARAHLRNCDQILKGWSPANAWPSRPRFDLSNELHKASEAIWKGHEKVLDVTKEATDASE